MRPDSFSSLRSAVFQMNTRTKPADKKAARAQQRKSPALDNGQRSRQSAPAAKKAKKKNVSKSTEQIQARRPDNYDQWIQKLADVNYAVRTHQNQTEPFERPVIIYADMPHGQICMSDISELCFEDMNGVQIAFYPDDTVSNVGLMRILPNVTKPMSTNDKDLVSFPIHKIVYID